VGRTWLSTPSGYLAEGFGWVGFWLFTVLAAVPGMVLLWIMWRRGFVVETVRQPGSQVLDEGDATEANLHEPSKTKPPAG
jgi:PAT family beta-lactamase induction signal transducer AmpG